MLTQVEARTDQGLLLTLPLEDISEGYVIRDIEGLDPVQATLVSSSIAGLDGEQYHSARREKRNIVLKLGLEPDYAIHSVRELRNRLYGFFMPKANVNLRFVSDDMPPVDISGRIETFDSPIFTREPKADVSIVCFDSNFVDPTPVVVNGTTVSTVTETPIVYSGSVETGFKFRLLVDRNISEFTIYLRPPDGTTRTLEFVTPLVAGDVLEINTSSGNKGATLTRSGVASSVLYGVSPYSSWINLYAGTNNLRVHAEGAAVPFTLEYTTKYGGL